MRTGCRLRVIAPRAGLPAANLISIVLVDNYYLSTGEAVGLWIMWITKLWITHHDVILTSQLDRG